MSFRLARQPNLQDAKNGVRFVDSQNRKRRAYHTPAIARDRREHLQNVREFETECRKYGFSLNAARFANGFEKRTVLEHFNRAVNALYFYATYVDPANEADLRRMVQGVIDGTGKPLEAFPLYTELTALAGAPPEETSESDGGDTSESDGETSSEEQTSESESGDDDGSARLRAEMLGVAQRASVRANDAANDAHEYAKQADVLSAQVIDAELAANVPEDKLAGPRISALYDRIRNFARQAHNEAGITYDINTDLGDLRDIEDMALLGEYAQNAEEAATRGVQAKTRAFELLERLQGMTEEAMKNAANPQDIGPGPEEEAERERKLNEAFRARDAQRREEAERAYQERLERERLEREEAEEAEEAEEQARLEREEAEEQARLDEDLYLISLKELGPGALTLAAQAAARRGAPREGPPLELMLAGLDAQGKARYLDPSVLALWPGQFDDTPWRALAASTTIVYREKKQAMPVPSNGATVDYMIGMFLSSYKFSWMANAVYGHILPSMGVRATRSPARLRLQRLAVMAARRAAFMARAQPAVARPLRMLAAVAGSPPRYTDDGTWYPPLSDYKNLRPWSYPELTRPKVPKPEDGVYDPVYETFFDGLAAGGPGMLRAFGVGNLSDAKARFAENTRPQDLDGIASALGSFIDYESNTTPDAIIAALDGLLKAVYDSDELGFGAPLRFVEIMMPTLLIQGLEGIKGNTTRGQPWPIEHFEKLDVGALRNYAYTDEEFPRLRTSQAQIDEMALITGMGSRPAVEPPRAPDVGPLATYYGDGKTDEEIPALEAAAETPQFDPGEFLDAFRGSVLSVKTDTTNGWLPQPSYYRIRATVSIPSLFRGMFMTDTLLDAFGTLMCRNNARFTYIPTAAVDNVRIKRLRDANFAFPLMTDLKHQHVYVMPINGAWAPQEWKDANRLVSTGDHWSLLVFQVILPRGGLGTVALVPRFHHMDSAPDEPSAVRSVQRLAAFYVAQKLIPALGFPYTNQLRDNLNAVTDPGRSEATKPRKESVAVWEHRIGVQERLNGACGRIVLGLMDVVINGMSKIGALYAKMNMSEYGKFNSDAVYEWMNLLDYRASGQGLDARARNGALEWFATAYGVVPDPKLADRVAFLVKLQLALEQLGAATATITVPEPDELWEGVETDENP